MHSPKMSKLTAGAVNVPVLVLGGKFERTEIIRD
jgi:hypothetical protein